MDSCAKPHPALFLPRQRLQPLLDLLSYAGYTILGPQLRDGAIVYAELTSVTELPHGIRIEQTPGRYTVNKTNDDHYFAWANGAQALKPLTFAPRESLWQAQRNAAGLLQFQEIKPQSQPTAVFGVRACDLAALAIQERVFLASAVRDPYYAARRETLFLIAVNCSHPAATCFCASTGDGPTATTHYDIVLTELAEGFILQVGSERAAQLIQPLQLLPPEDAHFFAAGRQHQEAVAAQSRSLPSRHLNETLFANLEHPYWEEIAAQCLACGNCTMVCPTCFCHSEQQQPQLDGSTTEQVREWDSCFTQGHSYIHGTTVRQSTQLRYRQWITHKLGSWHEQFGSSGCVGCGRCIAWCPVGIDITATVAAIVGENG
ncbi:MAG: asrAH [Halothiobacillaceae bacterium]|nr:MAG: asrAH [Halothiobacillaceae bacterium]